MIDECDPPALQEDATLILAYAQAQAALTLLADRLERSPLRAPWTTRIALAERHALAWIDNVAMPSECLHIDAIGRVSSTSFDLTHCKAAIGAPIALADLAGNAEQLLCWFGQTKDGCPNAGAGMRDRQDIVREIEQWMTACQSLPPSPPLLHGCRMALLWRQHSPLVRGDLVASLLLGDRWGPGRWRGSIGGLVALGLRITGSPWKLFADVKLERAWLSAIIAGVRAHLDMETRLLGFAIRARPVLERRKRTEGLKALLLFAMARPDVTSTQVARQLSMTAAGAIKLLSTAVSEGLLIERTGQSSFRSYYVPVSDKAASPAAAQDPARTLFQPDFWSDMA